MPESKTWCPEDKTVRVKPEDTVCDVKERISFMCGFRMRGRWKLCLAFKGKALMDEDLLSHHGARQGSKLTASLRINVSGAHRVILMLVCTTCF